MKLKQRAKTNSSKALGENFKYMEFKRNKQRLGVIVTKDDFYIVLVDLANMLNSATATITNRLSDESRLHIPQVNSKRRVRRYLNIMTVDGLIELFSGSKLPKVKKGQDAELFEWISNRVVPKSEGYCERFKLLNAPMQNGVARPALTPSSETAAKVAGVRNSHKAYKKPTVKRTSPVAVKLRTPKMLKAGRTGYFKNLFNAFFGVRV